MSDSVVSSGLSVALVLGGGGPVGLSWLAGLATGLRDNGIDLARADRFVGTSAGAVVGAVLADGGDPARLLRPPSTSAAPVRADPTRMAEIFAVLRAPGQDPAQARRRAGELALAAQVGAPDEHIARIGGLAGVTRWPARDLVVTAIDITTGELRAWTRDGAASLPAALASSTAVPGVFPPIPIDGSHYIDGGLRSPVNADLAAGADVVVILEPLAHMFPRVPSDRELGSATEVSIVPDDEAVAVIGLDVFDSAALAPAHAAGVRQAAEAASRLKDVWPNG
ncbi:patatin-like phospholipase family protein [Nocardia sp. CDC186]|uniref:Patatin-like phospholipase family protein n=1 Tax=Nocardia implantans TaxID=3108168 RepID=A0ABU6AV59_9NOCA|nr:MULTISPECIES: patatin-like phospholipase family protein [unclassified Nocardia]MBF6192434.1 patatin-like phospholipase family protein [Nocardia beijingensis]MEA3527662.1 patatin-like phospholipase family protein [Nocardia sp. CDC192]MEB3511370.1 patatin-like phospholipase family protein [Nocardia sp. CDC186]